MQKLFNIILVPVDFSQRSWMAAIKAAELARQYDCTIHLIHAVSFPPLAGVILAEGHVAVPYMTTDSNKEKDSQLENWRREIGTLMEQKLRIECSVLPGEWEDVIVDFAAKNRVDLVLIGQKGRGVRKRKMFLNPDKIAAKANIPVLTVPQNRRLTPLLSLVIPITDFLPVRKLIYGIYIASQSNTTVKLLGIENEDTKEKMRFYLKRAYQLIHDNCDLRVELETISSENVAEAVLQYSLQQSADLVIVNPGTQTRMGGFLSSWFGNVIQKYSGLPVLTISPD